MQAAGPIQSGRTHVHTLLSRVPGRTTALIQTLASVIARVFYRVTRVGDPVPPGPVLLVANHPNSLLDGCLVQATAGRPIRFLAKSPLFDAPVLGWFVRRSGAIPVYRRIDGVDLSRNEEMFAAVRAALARGDAVCLFPEGISHSTGRLEQLRTGAARIALSTAAGGVYPALVAIGLNFERKTAFRSRATVAFGGRFTYDDLVELYARDPAAAVRRLTDRIGAHLRQLIIEADPRAGAQLIARVDDLYSAARGVSRAPQDRLTRRRIIAAGIERLRERDPEQYALLHERVRTYDNRLARFGLRDRDLGWTAPIGTVVRFTIRELLYALLLGPMVLAAFVVFATPYWTTSWIGRVPKDAELRATWRAVGGIAIYGAWVVLLSAAAWQLAGATAGVAAGVLLPLLAMMGLFAFERERAVLRVSRAFFAARQTPAKARARLQRQQDEIAAVLERVYQWIELDPNSRLPAPGRLNKDE